MTQEAQTKQDTTQLLEPKSRREMLFQAAHCNSTIGRASGSGCNVEPLNDPIFSGRAFTRMYAGGVRLVANASW